MPGACLTCPKTGCTGVELKQTASSFRAGVVPFAAAADAGVVHQNIQLTEL